MEGSVLPVSLCLLIFPFLFNPLFLVCHLFQGRSRDGVFKNSSGFGDVRDQLLSNPGKFPPCLCEPVWRSRSRRYAQYHLTRRAGTLTPYWPDLLFVALLTHHMMSRVMPCSAMWVQGWWRLPLAHCGFIFRTSIWSLWPQHVSRQHRVDDLYSPSWNAYIYIFFLFWRIKKEQICCSAWTLWDCTFTSRRTNWRQRSPSLGTKSATSPTATKRYSANLMLNVKHSQTRPRTEHTRCDAFTVKLENSKGGIFVIPGGVKKKSVSNLDTCGNI